MTLARTRRALAAAAAAALALPFAARAQDPASDRAAELLASLTLEQKAGQLFMSWSLTRQSGDNHEQLLRWVRDAELGGVILSLGAVEDAAGLVPKLQAAAKVPLLLAGDFEGGVWFRLDGATELGNNMLFGATGSEWLCEQAGRITGEEAKALGFHWVFAPVLDVNSNPANPIINVRSFGEDPERVATFGSAYVRGVQGTGLIACGKHFPGHGDVATDSHLEMPTVPGDAARLHAVELRPFAAAVRAGLASIMTGHLAVPGLGVDPKLPATLSPHVLGDVLRQELGFDGLIVTDALDMGGVKNAFPANEVAVRALLAGADVLLMPPDPLAARAAVVDAVKSGRVPMARLDDAVRRILRSKAQVGLLAGGGRLDPEWRQRVRTPGSQRLAHDIAARGITLVRDRGELLPVGSNWNDDAVYVAVFDRDDGADLGAVLPGLQQRHRVSAKSSAAEVAAAVAAVAGAERVVLSLHVKVRSYSGGIALPEAVRPVVDALTEAQEVVAISFGNPYLVADLPAIDTYLCAYVDTATTRQVANAMLRGERPIDGRLPVSIPGVAERGTGLRRYRDDITGPGGTPVEDVDPELPARLRERLERAVADHAFPGAVCLVARHGERVAELAVGRWTYDPASAPVELDTLYDLASLTKVTATTPAVLRLVADGVLSLDDPVQKWVPAFAGEGKAAVTIRHLLTHCGGLPAYVRFFRTLQGKDAIVAAAAQEGLMVEPGTRTIYSDLGFILLMAVVEAASERPFAEFAPSVIFPFAGIEAHPRFVPTDGWSAGAPPTEQDGWRGRLVSGYVHDENAYAMGGVSGHAGLFARAGDILTLGLDLLAGGRGKLPPAIVAAATRPAGLVPGDTTRGLGYQMLQPGSWAGTTLSPGAFGHTGFTGTSLWCDPELDACVVLLSNRVHPTRVNNKITAVRRDVHDLVRAAMR